MAGATEQTLEELHLADLHAIAAERGISDYRLLSRKELVERLGGASGEGGRGEPGAARRAPEAGEAPAEREAEAGGPAEETEQVTGILDLMPARFGFLRRHGFEQHPDDAYISASQVRRCELRAGDAVSGPARPPRRGEHHPALVHVDAVNGAAPQEGERFDFDSLTPVIPERRIRLDRERDDVLLRAVDLLTPLAAGQRVLVRAAPRSGRTTLLRSIARALASDSEAPDPIVLLIDERPEEATAWREALPEAELAIATADLAPREQTRIAGLALERARRRAEAGQDVALIVDSLTRLAIAEEDAALVKRLFGSGRATTDAGSLTVIATVLSDDADEGAAERAVATTESSTIVLDRELAAGGIVPALRAAECAVSGEERLRDPEELAAVRRLRSLLADLEPAEAARLLRERIESTASNGELVSVL